MPPPVTSSARGRLSAMLLEQGGLLALVLLVIYGLLAPNHVIDGDNAEFATLGMTGGAAHPSGYPLYLGWLRITQWLPGTSPAHTAALATAVLGAAGAWVLFQACRAWGSRPIAATIATSIVASSPAVLRVATEAEVFALNNLAVATVLWLSAARAPVRGWTRAGVLGLVAGLGLANHLTCVLVAPVGLLGVLRGVRESPRSRSLGVMIVIGAFTIGLAPYLYLLATPATALSWGKVASASDLFAHIMRRDYGGATAFVPTGDAPTGAAQIGALARTLGRTWWIVGAVLGPIVLGMRVVRVRDDGGEPRIGWAMLALALLLAGPLLVIRFNIAPTNLGMYVLRRFHLVPALLLAVPIAVGLSGLVARVPSRIAAVLAVVALPASVAASLPTLARMHVPAVEQYARNVLGAVPPSAVVLVGSDAEFFAMSYLQAALGVRPDVVVMAPPLTVLPWYRQRMEGRGVAMAPEGLNATIADLVAHGRPVLVEQSRVDLVGELPWYPFATLLRALPPGSVIPPPADVLALNEELFSRFVLGYPRPGDADELATMIHRRYAGTWNALGRRLAANGDQVRASRAFAIAAELGPR